MRYSKNTLAKLYVLSGNTCAFMGCLEPIVDTEQGVMVGEVCHIKGKSAGGPRYDASQTARERDGFDNLLLMCQAHHTLIDHPDRLNEFTVEALQFLKQRREARSQGTPFRDDVIKALIHKALDDYLARSTNPVVLPIGSVSRISIADRVRQAEARTRLTYDLAYESSREVRKAIYKVLETKEDYRALKLSASENSGQTVIEHSRLCLFVYWPSVSTELEKAHLLASLQEWKPARKHIRDVQLFPLNRYYDGVDEVRWYFDYQRDNPYPTPSYLTPLEAADSIIWVLAGPASDDLPGY